MKRLSRDLRAKSLTMPLFLLSYHSLTVPLLYLRWHTVPYLDPQGPLSGRPGLSGRGSAGGVPSRCSPIRYRVCLTVPQCRPTVPLPPLSGLSRRITMRVCAPDSLTLCIYNRILLGFLQSRASLSGINLLEELIRSRRVRQKERESLRWC
jgi:hypothetical protein